MNKDTRYSREQIGFPLSRAIDNSIVSEWLIQLPEIKDAFANGLIIGILFFEIPIITVSQHIKTDLIGKIISTLGAKVRIV